MLFQTDQQKRQDETWTSPNEIYLALNILSNLRPFVQKDINSMNTKHWYYVTCSQAA